MDHLAMSDDDERQAGHEMPFHAGGDELIHLWQGRRGRRERKAQQNGGKLHVERWTAGG